MSELQQAWSSVLTQLQMDMPRASYETWVLGTVVLGLENDVLLVSTRNAYARDWLESRLTDFIQQYIFPGGCLPSPGALRDQAGRAGLEVVRELAFGQDYARTLRQWRAAFQARRGIEHGHACGRQRRGGVRAGARLGGGLPADHRRRRRPAPAGGG